MKYCGAGTLGDAYNAAYLRTFLPNEPNELIYWSTEHSYWEDSIREIFSMFNMRVEFEETERFPGNDCIRLMGAPLYLPQGSGKLKAKLSLLPNPDIKKHVDGIRGQYAVLQPHAGKPPISNEIMGSNSKFIPLNEIESIIKGGAKILLVGTHPYYEKLSGENVVNYVGKTTIHDLAYIVSNAGAFTGSIGLAAFIALSHCVPSYLYDAYWQPYTNRILPNEWRQYCISFKIIKYLRSLI